MTRIVTKGSDNWQPRHASQWQQERARGPILPMIPERRSIWEKVRDWRKVARDGREITL